MLNENKYYIKNLNLCNKKVVCRLDYNVPTMNGNITDDFRIVSSMPTLNMILEKNPKCVYIIAHFGRPVGIDDKYSLEIIMPILTKYLKPYKVLFLKEGLDTFKDKDITIAANKTVYLLENIRFYPEETNYNTTAFKIHNNSALELYKKLGDVYINDAFGCMHRNHMSISAASDYNKEIGYGCLVKKEVDNLNKLVNNRSKILGIVGGNKIKDKSTNIQLLKEMAKTSIFIAGGIAKNYGPSNLNEIVMVDGYGNINLELEPKYIENIQETNLNVYDIGCKSMYILERLIDANDLIFWNGSLGVIENDFYRLNSMRLISYLQENNKAVIMGGGETSSLITDKNKLSSNFYVSTGGGALLEYLEKKIRHNDTLIGLKIFE